MAMMNNDLSVIAEDEDGSFKDTITNMSVKNQNSYLTANPSALHQKKTEDRLGGPTPDKNSLDKLMKQMAQFSEYAATS
jgi:hypothetical protein